MDTEENIDVYFTRPIGLFFTLICKRLGIHPNAVTIFSFFLGAAAGYMFWHTDLWHNVWGVVLLMCANFCDSIDGQLARMTGKKTLTGRMLDGFASDVWFFCVYVAICLRLQGQLIPGLQLHWGIGIWLLCSLAGFVAHTRQCRLSDYYRNIHLFFLLGKEGSELNSYASQKAIADKYRAERNWVGVLFFANYAKYCRAQEAMTPEFQKLKAALTECYGSLDSVPQTFRDEFRKQSLPLMKYTNFLTHNWRAFVLFFSCLIDQPWIYPLFEVTVMHAAKVHMHHTHEEMCRKFRGALANTDGDAASQTSATREEELSGIKAMLFDFGGTLDTQGNHWGKVLWHAYERCRVPVTEEQFREAYVYAERKLGSEPLIQRTHTFHDMLAVKIGIEMQYVQEHFAKGMPDVARDAHAADILADVYAIVESNITQSRRVLDRLKTKGMPMVLVTNFYGNMHTVLDEFGLAPYFCDVIESAVVGVRKPDVKIYELALEALRRQMPDLRADEVCMVGDTIDKDIAPARVLGMRTIRIKGEPWKEGASGNTDADLTVDALEEINV